MECTKNISPDQKIAIVGIGCRYAGDVDTVEKFWEVLEEGRDCSSPHPDDRFDVSYFLSPGENLPGKMNNLRGCYLTQDPYKFDRDFFKISPDEAQHLDPAIRILMEVTWEALEDAGISAAAVRGSHTGVYIGGMSEAEYRTLLTQPVHNIGPYTNSGNTSCMFANRLSYEFDFRGPSVALDTACSSSLYATFLACEALKRNECPMALAGGLNIALLPQSMIGLSQAGMISPDGISKSFDKSANGYGRGEGFGVVVLKTVENAIRDGDRIYAVIRGGALSNDGRTTGIIAPSTEAQRKLLKAACVHAKVTPSDITYAEAHGTGTSLGDKTEATVLGEVFGQRRSPKQPPLYVGSIKSNLGHTEGAAGVAGMIKAALCFKHQLIPKVVHFSEPNPELDFKELNIHVPQCTMPWPTGEPYFASCSSFGFGGANACMIMEAAPTLNKIKGTKSKLDVTSKPVILVVSAATKEALRQRLRDWLTFLQCIEIVTNATLFRKALFTAAQRSQHHKYRLGIVVTTAVEAIELVQCKLDEGNMKDKCVEGVARPIGTSAKVAFVFSGMGTQWWGMARELMETEPIFATMIKRIAKKLNSNGSEWSLVNMLTKETNTEKINETEIAQPCICAVQIALVELWRYRGIVPDVVVGHSVGEVAAAFCAGLLSLDQAISLIYHRGRQLKETSGSGTMVAVLHPADEVLEKMRSKGYEKKLDIAAINSPSQVVISGDTDSINDLMTEFKSANIRCVQLKVRNAFHSRQQACLEKKFKNKVSKVLKSRYSLVGSGTKLVPMLSTVTGRYMTQEEASSPEYWWKNIRQKVLFKNSVETLVRDDFHVFLEIGPHQALTPAVTDTINNLQEPLVNLVTSGSLVRPRDTSKPTEDRVTLLLNHAQLFVSGVPVNFSSYFDKNCATIVSIPKYPWQRELCTAIDPETDKYYKYPVKHHPLLGEQQVFHMDIPSATPMKWWKAELSKSSVPWLRDHVIGGSIVFPAAAYIEVSLTAARVYFPDRLPTTLRNIDLQRFMYVPESKGYLETSTEQLSPSKVRATIRSCDPETKRWTQHMETDIVNHTTSAHGGSLDVATIRARCNVSLRAEEMQGIREGSGLTFGPSFQTTTSAFVNDTFSEIISYCEAPDVIFREFKMYMFHPAFLDGCLQSYGLLIGMSKISEAKERGTHIRFVKEVPSRIESFSLYKDPPRRICVHLSSRQRTDDISCYDISIADADSNDVVATINGLQFKRFEADAEISPHIWSTNWVGVPGTEQQIEDRRCLIIPDQSGISSAVAEHLEASGVDTVVASVVTDQKQTIRQYFNDSQSFTDILVLQPLDMTNLQSVINSTDSMDLEEFRKVQERFPLFCKFLLLEITDLRPEIWPRMIFITAGAREVISGENVNPFMSYVHSLLMTFMYEEPRLNAISVDVPLEVDVADTSLIIHEAFMNVPDDENFLAYRRGNQHNGTQEPTLTRFAPRLSSEPTANFRINTDNQSWIIQQDAGKPKLSVNPKVSRNLSTLSSDKAVVMDLHSFCLIPVSGDETNASAPSNTIVTIYAGEMQGSDSPAMILGISNRRPTLSSTMALEPSPCSPVEVPDGIDCTDAIYAAKEYLPAQIFFNDIFQLPISAHILYLTDSKTSYRCHSFPLLMYAKGARLTVVCVGKNYEASKMIGIQPNWNCNTINIEDVNDVDKLSVDLLIVPMSSGSLQKQVATLLPTLKKSGTTLYLFDGDNKQSMVMSGMAGMNIMYSTSVPKALFGQNPNTLLATINDICGLCERSKWLLTRLDRSDDVPLSQLLLVNGAVPHFTIITVIEEHTKLPFELHEDVWFAEKDASYLVTGGTSGFGLSLVKWLVSRGACQIYVISRQTPRDEVLKYMAEEKHAQIQHYSADVTNAFEIERVLTTIRDSKSPSLAGIFHLATEYRDGYLFQTTQDRWNMVMEGKAYGALLLHQLTLKLQIPLKYFVVASSIVSLMGNYGQGNYCSANNFLNSLCHMRRHQGLPATAMCIGLINSVGYATSNNLVKITEERGLMSLTPADVLKAFAAALTTEMPQVGIAGPVILRRFIQKSRVFIAHHFSESNGRFSLFKDWFADMDVINQSTGSFRQNLLEKPEEEARKLIVEKLCQVLLTQLGTPESVDTNVSLLSLGLDSLLATSMSEAIADHFEVTISPVELINDKTTITMLQTQIFNSIKMAPTNESNVTSNNVPTAQDRKVIAKPWIVETNETASLKMVCFPPTGGGASFFSSWSSHVAQFGIQLLVVQLPGWEGREDETPIHTLQENVEKVASELVHRLEDRKFVLLGHSMGSLFAFETANQLHANNLRPIHMFLSAWYAPTLPYPYPGELKNDSKIMFAGLKQVLEAGDDLLKYVKRENGMNMAFLDDTILSNRVIMLRFLPAIHATYDIIQAYRCKDRDPLQYGMTVFGGKSDPLVSPRLLSDWKRQVAKGHSFKKIIYEGKHMFILSEAENILKEVDLTLRKYWGKT